MYKEVIDSFDWSLFGLMNDVREIKKIIEEDEIPADSPID